MPELPRDISKLETKIGKGATSHVYLDNGNEKLVIKETSTEQIGNSERMKVSYYLHKIAHLLFPDQVPAIHASYFDKQTKKTQTIIDRVDTSVDPNHESVRKTVLESEDPHVDVFDDEIEIEYDPNVQSLIESLQNAGFTVDRTARNYARQGSKAVYLDAFGTNFDAKKIKQSIEIIPDTQTRKKAISYLNRLIDIRGY